jgi:hypothetical protein
MIHNIQLLQNVDLETAERLCKSISKNTYIITTLYKYSMLKNNINQFVTISKI